MVIEPGVLRIDVAKDTMRKGKWNNDSILLRVCFHSSEYVTNCLPTRSYSPSNLIIVIS